jgi:hypothetical protein
MNGVKTIDSMETLGTASVASNSDELDDIDELLSEILEEGQGDDKVVDKSIRKETTAEEVSDYF